MPGEFDFIDWIRGQSAQSHLLRVGIGDDLAVLNWPAEDLLLVGVDQVMDGVHFRSEQHPPSLIGRKVMNRNLSDCAAMACLPAAAVASVALPKTAGIQYAKELYLGMKQAGEPFDCPIVGGDTASWDGKLVVTVTILGRSAGIVPITRSGATPGDAIFVTGPLGGSLLGRHVDFPPRVELGRRLGKSGQVTAMIDLSDGLSRDIQHICRESSIGAIIEAQRIPIHDDARKMNDHRSPLEHALHDGEDHELLFTAPSNFAMAEVTRIGRIVAEPGLWLETDGRREPLAPLGWEHRL